MVKSLTIKKISDNDTTINWILAFISSQQAGHETPHTAHRKMYYLSDES